MNKTREQEFLIQNLISYIVSYIAEDRKITIEQAMVVFFSSEFSKKVEDIKTEYYWESPSYVYEIFKKEIGESQFNMPLIISRYTAKVKSYKKILMKKFLFP